MTKEYTDKILGTVILNESYRARSVSIKISKRNNSITLTYPTGYNIKKAISFLEEKRERILTIKERQQAQVEKNPPAESYDIDSLRAAAVEYLPRRIAEIAQQTNFTYSELKITTTRSKWGSCSSNNRISLSIFLMALPKHLIDFVIIHELCHTIHHNHSTQFHNLVNYVCNGKEKALIKELKEHSIR